MIQITVLILIIILVSVLIYYIITETKDCFAQQDSKLEQIKIELHDVHPLIQYIDLYQGDKSYTINKEKIYLCLYDENDEYYNINMLKYVFLHEFAHSLNKGIGHGKDWKDIFDALLERAIDIGVYNPDIPPILDYCNYND
jgi:hypothetical protein